MILEDFDKCKTSTFDPEEVINVIPNFPKIGVSCFSSKLLEKLDEVFKGEVIARISNANGYFPIYKINYNGIDMALFNSPVGASACVVALEEVFAMGLEKLVIYGTCGVLDSNISDLSIIIPSSAIRDEGTSYHYAKPTDEISVNQKYKEEFIKLLDEHNYSYTVGKTWTTDAPYRETRDKVLKRKNQGCICVEMECSAIFALANFREKEIFQFLYSADNLDAAKWDQRSLGNSDKLDEKSKIGLLAIEFANEIAKQKNRK
ncbi:MAG: nucleoside phosphorylase [Bacilli bacterium]|nr:nucleoside phosphorylase [Bacilli bacterium]